MANLRPDIAAAQARVLLKGVTDASTSESVRPELCQLVDFGLDGCVSVLQVCLHEVSSNAGELKNFPLKQDILSAIFRYCLNKRCFSTGFCEALRRQTATDGLLETLSEVLELSPAEKFAIGLALSESENSGIKLKGQQFTVAQIEELCLNPRQSISNDQIHEIVVFLHQTGMSKHMDNLNNCISLLKVPQSPFLAPLPNKHHDFRSTNTSRHLEMCSGSTNDDFQSLLSEIGKEMSVADIFTELGYGCTVDSAHCIAILSNFEPLDDKAISKLLGAVIGTHSCHGKAHYTYSTFVSAFQNVHSSDSAQLTAWNTDVLVSSINELAPSTNWVHVMENLDHEGFSIPDETAFCLLMSIYACVCKEPFPLHAVCGSLWTNTEGQISFLKHAVSAPANKFTFSHCSRQLAFPDLASLSPGNHAWYCLDLLEILCQLAEVGHIVPVRSMLEYPLGHCPELLLVGLGHVNTAYNLLQYEVLSCVFPAVLKDTAKSNVVKYLWNINPLLTLRGFINAHSDPNCLLRIVDVCQDLKILCAVLKSTPFAFSIKLAAAASRKDRSHVEKWLIDMLFVYKNHFLQECINFFKVVMSSTLMEQPQAVVMNIYWESCPLFVKVVQSHSGKLLSTQLLDELMSLYGLVYPQVRKLSMEINRMKEHIELIEDNLAYSENIVSEGESRIAALVRSMRNHCGSRDDVLIKFFGSKVKSLENGCRKNEKDLRLIEKGLHANLSQIGAHLTFPVSVDDLLPKIEDIHRRNKLFSRAACKTISQFDVYKSRFRLEKKWITEMDRTLRSHGLFRNYATVIARLRAYLARLCEISNSLASSNLHYSRSVIRRNKPLELAMMLLNSSSGFRQDVRVKYGLLRNREFMIIQKVSACEKFDLAEKSIEEKIPMHIESLDNLTKEVTDAYEEYEKNIGSLEGLKEADFIYKNFNGTDVFSWRERKLRGYNIISAVKTQGKGECAFVSSVSMTESLYMKDHAETASTARNSNSEEFIIKLSHHHLKDLVTEFYARNKCKGNEKLDICLELMKTQGIVTEEAYNNAKCESFETYHIKEFESLNPAAVEDACALLRQGIVLIGNFQITTQYHRLKPGDIYQIPEKAIFEMTPGGAICSHCVVIVGYGVSDEGVPYFVFQNSYGPGWGSGGYGRVAVDCMKYIYTANLN